MIPCDYFARCFPWFPHIPWPSVLLRHGHLVLARALRAQRGRGLRRVHWQVVDGGVRQAIGEEVVQAIVVGHFLDIFTGGMDEMNEMDETEISRGFQHLWRLNVVWL